jgi:gluconate kinase
MDPVRVIPELAGWVPARLLTLQPEPLVDWCYLGRRRFTDPFFSQTVESCIHRPFNLLFRHQTQIEVLREWVSMRPGLAPGGFIFHMSRCGSTLVSQLLAALPAHVVIAEAGPIDSILRAHKHYPNLTEEDRINWLRWMISALGQPRAGSENKLFIKFDSWNILDFDLVRNAFPTVPWVFVYREPVAVLASHMSQRGAFTIPALFAPDFFGLDQQSADQSSVEEYCARVLAALCRAGLEAHRAGGGLLINYKQLPEAMFQSILPYFSVACDESEIQRLRELSRFDSKNRTMPFMEDPPAKKDSVREAALKWLQPVYDELESARVNA